MLSFISLCMGVGVLYGVFFQTVCFSFSAIIPSSRSTSTEIDDDGGAVSDNDAGRLPMMPEEGGRAPALDSCCDGDEQLLSTAYGCVGGACGCSKGPTGSLEVVARCPGCGGARRSPVRGGHARRRSYRN